MEPYKHHKVVHLCEKSLKRIQLKKNRIVQKLAYVLHNFIPGTFFSNRGGGVLKYRNHNKSSGGGWQFMSLLRTVNILIVWL